MLWVRRGARWLAAAFLFLVLAGVIGTLVPWPFSTHARADAKTGETRRVLLLSNAIHTDIALPPDPDVLQALDFLEHSGLPLDNPGLRWIVAGWGGRSFYLETPSWSELKPGPVFRALTADSAVMHVALAGEIEADGVEAIAIDLSEEQFDALIGRIRAGFNSPGADVTEAIPGSSYGEYGRFYESNGTFNALFGCNTWTASALRAAGLRTGMWNPLPVSLRWSLKRFNAGLPE